MALRIARILKIIYACCTRLKFFQTVYVPDATSPQQRVRFVWKEPGAL